jgi:hypothetical protein
MTPADAVLWFAAGVLVGYLSGLSAVRAVRGTR